MTDTSKTKVYVEDKVLFWSELNRTGYRQRNWTNTSRLEAPILQVLSGPRLGLNDADVLK